MYPYIYNFEEQKYTIFMEEKPVTIAVSDPRYSQLDDVFDRYSKDEFSSDSAENDRLATEEIKRVVSRSVKEVLREAAKDIVDSADFEDLTLSYSSDGTISAYYKTQRLPKVLADKFYDMYKDGCTNFDMYFKFLDNIMKNPRDSVKEELYDFLAAESLPITQDGTFIAYKGVRADLYSVTGSHKHNGKFTTTVLQGTVDSEGRIYNGIGETIRVRVKDVCDDRSVGCAQGLHVGSYSYANDFGSVTLAVEVNPMDVVSVPTDCSCQKCRVSEYTVRNVVKGRYTTPTVDTTDDGAVVETNNNPRRIAEGRSVNSISNSDAILEDIKTQIITHKAYVDGSCTKLPGQSSLGSTNIRQLRGSVGRKYGLTTSEVVSLVQKNDDVFVLVYGNHGLGSAIVELV